MISGGNSILLFLDVGSGTCFFEVENHLPISLWNLGTVQILIGLNSHFA